METLFFNEDKHVLGVEVADFPQGINSAFQAIVKKFPPDDGRFYYGIFQMDKTGRMHYYATAEENDKNAATPGYSWYTIARGEYLAESLADWQNNKDCIKDVFKRMSTDERVDHSKPGVEWYKNQNEMICLLKLKA